MADRPGARRRRIAEIIRETNDGLGSIALAVDEQPRMARQISD